MCSLVSEFTPYQLNILLLIPGYSPPLVTGYSLFIPWISTNFSRWTNPYLNIPFLYKSCTKIVLNHVVTIVAQIESFTQSKLRCTDVTDTVFFLKNESPGVLRRPVLWDSQNRWTLQENWGVRGDRLGDQRTRLGETHSQDANTHTHMSASALRTPPPPPQAKTFPVVYRTTVQVHTVQ